MKRQSMEEYVEEMMKRKEKEDEQGYSHGSSYQRP